MEGAEAEGDALPLGNIDKGLAHNHVIEVARYFAVSKRAISSEKRSLPA